MSARMKLRVLEECLQGLEGFEKPKMNLEQYATPPHIASRMIHTMQASFDDIEGRSVCDLGAGCGMLSMGAALLEAAYVMSVEIDSDAVTLYLDNKEELEITNADIVVADVLRGIPSNFEKKFDTVIMNPPFGTKNNQGIDMEFLNVAMKLSTNAIYSLHKTSTRAHILKKAKSLGAKAKVVAELRYDLPATYKCHKKGSIDIAVDFWRFEIQ